MKRLTLILLLFSFLEARAQQGQMAGFVVANATDQKMQLLVDGKNLIPTGIESGTATSGIPLTLGSHQIEVSIPAKSQELRPAKAALTIALGTCPILVAYVEEAVDPTTRQVKKALRVVQLAQKPQKERFITTTMSLVSPPQPVSVSLNGTPVSLTYLKPQVSEGRRFVIADGPNQLEDAEYSEKCSQFCLVFKGANNKLRSILVPDMIYTW